MQEAGGGVTVSSSKVPGWVRVRAWCSLEAACTERSECWNEAKGSTAGPGPTGRFVCRTAGVQELWRVQEPEGGWRLFGFDEMWIAKAWMKEGTEGHFLTYWSVASFAVLLRYPSTGYPWWKVSINPWALELFRGIGYGLCCQLGVFRAFPWQLLALSSLRTLCQDLCRAQVGLRSWWSHGTWRSSFSKVCHFSRWAAQQLLDRGLAEDQAVVTRLPGRRRSLLAHNPLSPSGTIQRIASGLADKSLMPALPRSTHAMQVLPSAASRAPRPQSCSTPLLWVKGQLSAHSAYITLFLWIGERMCLKTGIYILPLPTPSPWGGGASPLPAAVLGIAAGMLLVCRRAWRSGLGLQPAQLLCGGSRGNGSCFLSYKERTTPSGKRCWSASQISKANRICIFCANV